MRPLGADDLRECCIAGALVERVAGSVVRTVSVSDGGEGGVGGIESTDSEGCIRLLLLLFRS